MRYRVLFIDDREMDNMLNRLMVREEQLPFDATYITSGEEALEFLNDQTDEDFPQVIFVDINMPIMNGFEFVDRFNAQLANQPKAIHTILCFLTSSISDSEKERALGMQNVSAFYNKPITKAIFADLQIRLKGQ